MNCWLLPTLLVALALFRTGLWAARQWSSSLAIVLWCALGLLASAPALIFALYYLKVFHEPVWLYSFRAVPGSEVAAGGAGFLAGLLHAWLSSRARFRRVAGPGFFPGVLLLGLLVPYAKPLLRPPHWSQFQDRWSDGICLQTCDSSCGPACAATLLRQLGKPATEQALARESFTSLSGTENWYLARALRRRGVKVRFQVERDATKPLPFPSIAGVTLSGPVFSGHFITILGLVKDRYIIGDPLEGRLVLSIRELREKYAFTGFLMRLD